MIKIEAGEVSRAKTLKPYIPSTEKQKHKLDSQCSPERQRKIKKERERDGYPFQDHPYKCLWCFISSFIEDTSLQLTLKLSVSRNPSPLWRISPIKSHRRGLFMEAWNIPCGRRHFVFMMETSSDSLWKLVQELHFSASLVYRAHFTPLPLIPPSAYRLPQLCTSPEIPS